MSRRGHNTRKGIVIDTDDRAFSRPDREQEPDREFNREAAREPLDETRILSVEERLGYRRALGPEVPGNIERYQRAGWTVVTSASANSSGDHGRTVGQLDSVVRIHLTKRSDADWHSAVLMEITIEYWNEDEEARMQKVAKREESLNPEKFKQKGLDDAYGYLRREKRQLKNNNFNK